jgi:hypothetical protein
MMTANERTMQWMRDNPEKYEALKRRERAKKVARQNEAIAAWRKSRFKTPLAAIRGFCRVCQNGCANECPLYAYRYGDARMILKGRKENNIAVVHTANK